MPTIEIRIIRYAGTYSLISWGLCLRIPRSRIIDPADVPVAVPAPQGPGKRVPHSLRQPDVFFEDVVADGDLALLDGPVQRLVVSLLEIREGCVDAQFA